MTSPQVRVTVNGRLALTIDQLAARHNLGESSIRAITSRLSIEPATKIGKSPVYYATDFDKAIRERPGTGWHLRAENRATSPTRKSR